MIFRTGLARFTALLLIGLPLGSVAAEERDSLAKIRESYRRPTSIPFPVNNPYTQEKFELGKKLFFDPLLSRSKKISCATCHQPSLSWGDGRTRAIGEDPRGMSLRSPTLIDTAFVEPLGWDGKFADIESVTFGPITNSVNMNLSEAELVARLSAVPAYTKAFTGTFDGGEITKSRIEMALATFQRTIVAGDAPFDRWIKGNEKAIGLAAKRGFILFNGKANCANCHSGSSFTDGSFQDIGTATGDDIGRGRLFPTSEKLQYAFKTPTLRNVVNRAPYMHNGSVKTLADVIELYNKGGIDRPSRSPLVKPLSLTAKEKADLVAFLRTLSAAQSPPPASKPPG